MPSLSARPLLVIVGAAIALVFGAQIALAASGGPTVTLSSTSASSSNATSIPITATFSQPVDGFTSSDISATNGSVSDVSSSASSTVFTFNVNRTASDTVSVFVPADVAFASSSAASSTGNQASNTLTFSPIAISSSTSTATSTPTTTATSTSTTASSTPLALNSVDTVRSSASADDTFANGWKWTLHFTVPDTENAFRMKFSDFIGASSSTIPAAANIRIFSAQSSNASTESTAITENSNDYGDWLLLTGDENATAAGRQIAVTVEVRIPTGTAAGSYTTTFGAQSLPQSVASSTTP